MTQKLFSRRGIITPEMKAVAIRENLPSQTICALVASGLMVIPANPIHQSLEPCGFGPGLTPMAMIRTSRSKGLQEPLAAKFRHQGNAVVDESPGFYKLYRQRLVKICPYPLGSTPARRAINKAPLKPGCPSGIFHEDVLRTISEDAESGMDFILLPCMLFPHELNPLNKRYDKLLDIALKYDITIILEPGVNPKSRNIHQVQDLFTLSALVARADARGVQVCVNSPVISTNPLAPRTLTG